MTSPTPANIKNLREQSGLSMQALADKMGIRKEAIYRWESGKRNIKPTHWLLMQTLLKK